MKNLEAKYKLLTEINNLKGLTTDAALEHIGLLIDLSLDLRQTDGLNHAIKLSKELQKRRLTAGQLATSHYFLGNSWANLRALLRSGNDLWEWEQKEMENEISHLRRALHKDEISELPVERSCQILTNLGNLMDIVGRFIEAIEYWDKALAKLPSFAMARGNRGIGLAHYAHALYDKGHALIFLKYSYADLKTALLSELHEDARKDFDKYRMRIESKYTKEVLDKDFNMNSFSLGASEQESRYRRWCLENGLFLNPLNDLGPHPIAARDILTTPSIVVDIGEGPYYQGYFNQMKQEFVSARHQYYEGISAEQSHFSDRGVLLYNTLDYPVYSLAVEKVKSAFRTSYSLFDKIAYFLNHYLDRSIPERDVSFRGLWYRSQRKNKVLRSDFQQRQNWPLRGLFWLSKDLFEDKPFFKKSIEPDAKALREIRNHLEHKYLKIHEDAWQGTPKDTLAFSIHRNEFETKTFKILRMTRAALMYLSLAIHFEEQRCVKGRSANKSVLEIPLSLWKYEWKH